MNLSGTAKVLALGVVALIAYVVVFVVVLNRVELPPLGPETVSVVAAAALIQLGSVWFFGELFRQGVIASGRFVTPGAAFRAALVGSTVARVLPVGGAVTPVAMAWAVREDAPGAGGAAFRATALNYAGLLIGTGLALAWVGIMGQGVALPVSLTTIGTVGALVGLLIMGGSSRLGGLADRLPNWLRRRLGPTMIDLAPDLQAQGFLWGRLVAEAAVLGIVLAAFDLDIGLVEVAAAFGASQLAAGIPGTPGGIGFAEAGLVGVLALFGLGASVTIVPVLVFRIVSYWLPAGAGLAAGSAAFLERRGTVFDMDHSFTLPDQDGNMVMTDDFAGKSLIVFFYPKAMTPGCTAEACAFRESYDAFLDAGYEIVGVSPDPPEANARFREKENLPFPLLSDEDHAVAEKFGAWGTKKAYGKETEGLIRSTFVIGPEGGLEAEYRNVKAAGHVDRLKRDLLP